MLLSIVVISIACVLGIYLHLLQNTEIKGNVKIKCSIYIYI